ncbi:efflux transporter outer membrane subunit [Rhodocyclus tenuis]|uniref:efflux transporter outer membrane subunit n=1 Tax=Rhodocyclus tenuis TaxID=1066 RepID=UPI001F5B417C|nr:efflux transporter outer membrane subunit [Rhodocyclus tenuis]
MMAARKLQESSSLLDAAAARAAAPAKLVARQRPLLAAMAALGVLGLSGCAIGPDFVRPASTLPGQYAVSSGTEAATETTTETAAIEPDWWKQFKDPVLDDLLDKALVQNADLRIAIARVEQAEAAAREAGGALLPQIDAQASGSRARYSSMNAIPLSGSTPVQRDARSAALTTSYELDVWGRVRRGYESVRASALASQYSRDAIRLSVAGLVTNSYLALRAYDAQLAVADESLATRKTTLELIRTRVDAGLVSPLDQHQAEGNLAAIAAQTASLRLQRAQTEHQLALLVGAPDLHIAPGDLRQLPLPPLPPAGLPSSLVQARPDVRQAEENLVSANAGIGVAKAGYFPKFTLTGSLGSESKTLENLFSAGAGTWALGLGALMPIIDFGRTSARVDQATAQQKQSLVAYQNTLQTAFKEVKDALVSVRENAAGEAAQAARVEASAKALKIAQLRYDAGYSGYLDVLEAQRSNNDSLQSLISTRQARLTAAVDLFKALGGGWKDEIAPEGRRADAAR